MTEIDTLVYRWGGKTFETFGKYGLISRKWHKIDIQWLWTTYRRKSHVVYRMVTLPMTFSDLQPYLGNYKTGFV